MATFDVVEEDDQGTFGVPHRNGDDWVNSGHDQMIIRNGRGTPVNIHVYAVGKCSLGALHDYVRTVSAGYTRLCGPFDRYVYNAFETSLARFQFKTTGGALLPDDDGQGHPASLGVMFLKVA